MINLPSFSEGILRYNFYPEVEKVKTHLNKLPGFFSPYKNSMDFGVDVGLMVVSPVFLGVLTALCAMASGVASIVFVVGLFATLPFAIAKKDDLQDKTLTTALTAGVITFAAPFFAALSAFFIIASLVVFPSRLVVRSGATIVNSIQDFVAGFNEEQHPVLAPGGVK